MVEFKRVGNGVFEVYRDGGKTTWQIINGSVGLSGNGRNMYGIVRADGTGLRWIGSLASAKKCLVLTLSKEGK